MSSGTASPRRATATALGLAFAALVFPVTVAATQSKCAPPTGTVSAVYIMFERVTEIETGRKEAVLRLVNGSACDIVVRTINPTVSVVSEHGLKVIGDGEELPDGARLELHYFELELRASGWEAASHVGGCVSMNRTVLPGRSVLFRVPLYTFERHRNVETYFNLAGEDPADSEHSAAFSWNLVPGL